MRSGHNMLTNTLYICEQIGDKGPLCPRMLLPIQAKIMKIKKGVLKIVLLHHH